MGGPGFGTPGDQAHVVGRARRDARSPVHPQNRRNEVYDFCLSDAVIERLASLIHENCQRQRSACKQL